MRLPIFVVLLFSIVNLAYGEPIETLENILVYPVEPPTRKSKRETASGKTNINEFQKFVEEKLVQQTVALEYIMKLLHSNEESTKAIVQNLGENISKPNLPEKIEAQYTRRNNVEPDQDNSVLKFIKNFPAYGTFLVKLIKAELHSDSVDGTEDVQAQQTIDLYYYLYAWKILFRFILFSYKLLFLWNLLYFYSRRSFMGGNPMLVPNNQDDNKISPWCAVAILCHRKMDPVCGYDDNFGYGKFDDVCHMLQVNCYWRYNFALVPSCKPIFEVNPKS